MPYTKNNNIIEGDLVITHNGRLGTVVRLGRDHFGDYIIVKLDMLKWEFAYDLWDIEKVSDL